MAEPRLKVYELLPDDIKDLLHLLNVATIWQSLGVFFAVLAVIFSIAHLVRHILFNKSVIRKCTVRILFMVPMYAIDSAVCLLCENTEWKWSEPLSLIREVYEAIALLSFMQFVLTVKGGAICIAKELEDKHPGEVPQMPPLRYCVECCPLRWVLPASYTQGPHFIAHMLGGIAQYAVVMILVLILNVLVWALTLASIIQDKTTFHDLLLVFITQFKAFSNAWALYCLVLFAHSASEIFPPARFGCKILAIKGIVFFTFWQEKVIKILYQIGMLSKLLTVLDFIAVELSMGKFTWDEDNYQRGLNDFLLCIETFVFCFIHWCAYMPHEWKDVPLSNPSAVVHEQPVISPVESLAGHVIEIKQIFGDIFKLYAQGQADGNWPMSPGSKSSVPGDLNVPLRLDSVT